MFANRYHLSLTLLIGFGIGACSNEVQLFTCTESEQCSQQQEQLKQIPVAAAVENGLQDQLPAHFDWRNNGGNYLTSPKNQLHCASCYAFAILGVMEAMAKISRNNPYWNLDLSEQQLLSCGNFPCEWVEIADVLDYIVNSGGVATESCLPYEAVQGGFCSLCENWQDQSVRITSWERVNTDTESIKHKLLEGPIIVSLWLYRDFISYKGGVYVHRWGEPYSQHYAIIVGWDDQDQAWILKNSWGQYWGEDSYAATGERGCFRIKYGELNVQQEQGYALQVELPACSCEDADGDGFYSASCSDARCMPKTDCKKNDADIHPGAPENCQDGLDNDCNGFTDKEDRSCKIRSSGCSSLPGTPEACSWWLLLILDTLRRLARISHKPLRK